MGKNKFTQTQIAEIQNMTLNQMAKAITSGKYSEKQLRQAYTQMRDIAMKRIGTLNKERNIKEFGKQNLYIQNGEYFRKLKGITSESELLKEIKDVSSFLKSKVTTIKGLKHKKEQTLKALRDQGVDTSSIDYPEYLKFLKWFKGSEFAKKIPSDEPVLKEIFESSPNHNKEEWTKVFKEYLKHANKSVPRRQY